MIFVGARVELAGANNFAEHRSTPLTCGGRSRSWSLVGSRLDAGLGKGVRIGCLQKSKRKFRIDEKNWILCVDGYLCTTSSFVLWVE